jgi:hypothetical protein
METKTPGSINVKPSAEKRVEALMKRKAAIAAALRLEHEKRKEIAQRDQERKVGIVGRAVLANAAQSPEFKEFLIGILRTTVTDQSEEKFLKLHGWL